MSKPFLTASVITLLSAYVKSLLTARATRTSSAAKLVKATAVLARLASTPSTVYGQENPGVSFPSNLRTCLLAVSPNEVWVKVLVGETMTPPL